MFKTNIKTHSLRNILFILLSASLIFACGCGNSKADNSETNTSDTSNAATVTNSIEVIRETPDESEVIESEIIESDEEISEETPDSEDAILSNEPSDESSDEPSEESSDEPSEVISDESSAEPSELPPIIWLGDSLTQGSLGDDNGNVNNPQAPWRVIKANHGIDIAGYGYYAYTTHDIFWKYGEDGGKKDSSKIYIFWVGANDFVLSDTAINDVIGEINRFVEAGNITKYIVVGTTDRELLGHDKAVAINQTFKSTYGSKYIDILKYIEFGPDGTHLTANSYAMIGEAVYQKVINTYK